MKTCPRLALVALVALLALLALLASTTGCSFDLVGTGSEPIPDPKGGANQNQNPTTNPKNPSGSGTAGVAAQPTASGAPVEIEALFAPPLTDIVTPDTLFGVWAGNVNETEEERIKFGATDITLAKKCKADGRIAYVSVKVRATDSKITILESKKATLDYTSKSACYIAIELVVGEWSNCNVSNDYDCFTIYGTQLKGLSSKMSAAGIDSRSWLKLSD